MRIDQKARDRLLEERKTRQFLDAVQPQPALEFPTDQIIKPLEKSQKTNSNQLAVSAILVALVKKIFGAILHIVNKMPSREDVDGIKQAVEAINIPALPEIVKTDNQELIQAIKSIKIPSPETEITVENLSEIVAQFKPLIQAIENLKSAQTQKVEVINPTRFDTTKLEDLISSFIAKIPTSQPKKEKAAPIDLSEVTTLLTEIRESLDNLPVGNGSEFPTSISVDNFPVTMTPQPVTKIDINPLRGEFKSTGVTVGIEAVPLPITALSRRRAMIIFNNDNVKTMYIGGANVTASGTTIGLPVPPQTYSPPVDCASNMLLYGIASSGSVQAITLELSNDYGTTSTSIGNV